MIALLVVGGMGALSAGGCMVCVAIGAKANRDEAGIATAAVGAPRPEAPFVATLVRLASDPKSVKASLMNDDFDDPQRTKSGAFIGKPDKKDKNINYRYSSPPGIPVNTLDLSVRKSDPAAWKFSFEEQDTADGGAAPTIHKEDLGELTQVRYPNGNDEVAEYEIASGPLNSAVLKDFRGGGFTITSLPYAISEGNRWVCENRVPGVPKWLDFEFQCRDMVAEKLLVPSSAEFDCGQWKSSACEHVKPGCGWEWVAWVESKNAFNVPIRRKFVCERDPKAHTVSFRLE